MPVATKTKKATKIAGKKVPSSQQATRRFCTIRATTPPVLDSGISGDRARLILQNRTKWVNGTTLNYYFFDKKEDGAYQEYTDGTKVWKKWKGTDAQMNVVRKAFGIWKKLGIGLNFKEVKSREEAQIRIGFMEDDGSWSYIGRDILKQPKHERTMNFGWNIAVPDKHNGIDTALHEIGHAIGFPHEHQNPFSGILWNEEAVYASLGAPPNSWDRNTTYQNIIKKLSKDEVNGSKWDPNSIMHYPFEKGLILQPKEYANGLEPAGGLSPQDIHYALYFYPETNAKKDIVISEMVSYDIDLKNSEQQNFVFKPEESRYYTIQTFGKVDTVMVLNEQLSSGKLEYISGDDNSGTENNASIRTKLFRGKTYLIHLRVYYKNAKEKSAIMIS